MNKKTIIVLAFASMAGVGAAQQTGFYSDGRPERLFYTVSGVDRHDAQFLRIAQASNEFEIRSSEMAMERGGSEFIREFAKEMLGDHKAAKNEVSQVAEQKSLNVNGELPLFLEKKINRLKGLHGNAFDREYRSMQKEGHQNTINLLKSEVAHGHDQDVKAVAVKLLPTVEMHYKMLLTGKTMMGATASDHGM